MERRVKMTTEAKIQLTSTELGTLWMTYQSTSASLKLFDLFKEKTIDKEAQNILSDYTTECQNIKSNIENIFKNDNAIIPMGFLEADIIKEATPLFDDFFNIMFLRQMMKLNLGNSAIASAMSYMKEVNDVLKLNYDVANNYFMRSSNYLLKKGVLPSPPYATMPIQVEFIEDKNYMSGFHIISDKRALNTVEVGYITEAIQSNIVGMQLMTGFAQVAKESEVKAYFIEGKELSKKTITDLSDLLLQSDIQPPSTWAGKATNSQVPLFSDKLMMYITSLLSSAGIGYTAMGTSFSMRSDLHLKFAEIAKHIFDFAKKGGKIAIKHRWMEEPPQMEDRNQLTK
jgi:hypothetical protein